MPLQLVLWQTLFMVATVWIISHGVIKGLERAIRWFMPLLFVLLMVLPRFTESLHPGKGGNPAFSSYDLDSALRAAFYPAVLGWMILGTWMYQLQLRIEQTRERIAEAQLTRSNMPLALLFVPQASTSSLETVFMASGKMPVVVGVARA